MAKTGYGYLVISLLCLLFGAGYEQFSHEVYSGYMVYAFVFPLVGGALPFATMALFRCQRLPGRCSMNLYHSGIASFTVGSMMEGVLEIYGTTNELLLVYWYVGAGFAAAGVLLYLLALLVGKERAEEQYQ
ncbi:MAG: hypothetical protein AB7E30_10155 [Lawsonibacter sp.]